MISGLASTVDFGLSASLSGAGKTEGSRPAGVAERLAQTEEKAKAYQSVAWTLKAMTDPAAKLAQAEANLSREMTRAEAELKALETMRVIDPEGAARAAERILSRLDRAVSAYTAAASSLKSSGQGASTRSPEAAANELKAAAQNAANAAAKDAEQLAAEAKNQAEKAVQDTEGLRQSLLGEIDEMKSSREEGLKGLRAESAAAAAGSGEAKGDEELIEKIERLAERALLIAEGGDEESDENASASARSIDENLQSAGQALAQFRQLGGETAVPVDVRL